MSRAVPGNSRLEIKFVVNELDRDRLINWLTLHPAGFSSPHPPRWISNIYFDTYDYSAFRQNLTGASERSKLRYRWYGVDRYPDRGALELKSKRNYFGWKSRFSVEEPPYIRGDHWRDIRAKLELQLPLDGQIILASNPQPTVLTRYFRRYFTTSDRKVRATIDTQQSVYDQRYKPYPNTSRRANISSTVVLELKFSRKDRERAAALMQGLPVRVSRNSKYVIGLRSVHGF